MKTAKVTPIFKSGDKKLPSNYRPISILPFLSKILERIFNTKLTNYLLENNLIIANQYGFLPGRSTTLAATDLFETVASNLNNNTSSITISLDLTKAFDCLSHPILLHKLEYYGIRGIPLAWITSYLSFRNQTTLLSESNVSSDYCPLQHAVPQGSILGANLFTIYINDLPFSSNSLKFILYADDTTLIDPFTIYNQIALQPELDKVASWFFHNKLVLNPKKELKRSVSQKY